MYNIIDIKKLSETLQIPIIGVSYHDSSGIKDSLKHHFPNSFESKLNKYEKLGQREKFLKNTSHDVYVRKEGCTLNEVKHLLMI